MAAQHRDWKREDHLLAFSLYCKIPSNQASDRHLMRIEGGYAICFSRGPGEPVGTKNETIRWLTSFDRARLLLPKKFAPDSQFLKRHAEKCVV